MYDSNAAELADVFGPGEVECLVRFYGRAKGLLDALRGWEAAGAVEYAGGEDRLAAMGWAIDRLRPAHRDLHKLVPEVMAGLRAEAGRDRARAGGGPPPPSPP